MVKDKAKRDSFIENNLGLVHSLCKRFCGKGIEYDDLYQAGCMGLVKAADAFDEERGFCFSTYAVPVILGEIKRLFRDGGSVKVSRSVKELAMRINREQSRFERDFGREPTVCELSEILGVAAEEITEAVCASQPTVSLTYEDGDKEFQLDLPTISAEEEISDRIFIDEAFKKLDEVEQKIIKYRFYDGMTQSKTAKILSMTQVQVSRSEKKILCKLREIMK